MNITFLIGNGFDISCGFKTRYCDFYNYYSRINSSDSDLNSFKSLIASDPITWSDAEIAFGKASSNYNTNNVDTFRMIYDDFIMHLSKYLFLETDGFLQSIREKSDINKFIEGATTFENFLPASSEEFFNNYFTQFRAETRNYYFINFNYTNVFDSFISIAQENKTLSRTQYYNSVELPNEMKEVLHVHGSIYKKPLVMGVDNINQIENTALHEKIRLTRTLVKPVANDLYRNTVFNNCKSVIQSSSVVCIFGMSLGSSDSYWWLLIGEWLLQDVRNHLVIFFWDELCIKDSIGSCLDCEENCITLVRRIFFKNDDYFELVKPRIHIGLNINLFNVSNLKEYST